MLNDLKEDLRIFSEKHHQNIFKYFYYPDVRVILIFRLSQWCFHHHLKPIAYILTNLNDFFHGVWIGPKVVAGKGLFLGHPRGVVMSPNTIIGEYCTIINQVTIGGPSVIIEDYVEIGVGAKIISTPKNVLITEPRPPIKLVPPITTAAITCSSRPEPGPRPRGKGLWTSASRRGLRRRACHPAASCSRLPWFLWGATHWIESERRRQRHR